MREPWEDCPPRKRLKLYVQNQLEGKYNEWTYRHLKFCDKCLDKVAQWQKTPSPDQIIASGGLWGKLKAWWQQR